MNVRNHRGAAPLAFVAVLAAWSSPGAAAGEAEREAVELCIQRPAGGIRTLGHVRLVVGEVFYERRTPDDELSGQPTEERLDEVRNRKSRAFLHVMPPMLRFPLSRRVSWGVFVRDRVPDRQKHPDGSEYWPFECVDVPTRPEQRAALRRLGDGRFADPPGDAPDRALAFDHEFDYVHDNCTTSVGHLLADGLAEAPSGAAHELALIDLLRDENRPLRLLRRLRAWAEEQGTAVAGP